jgi:hypothetical protein
MAWQETIYVQFPDETTARTMATSLGVDFPESGAIPTGNQNYAMHAPMQPPWVTPPVIDAEGVLVTPGVAETGYWAMLRFNMDWPGYAATMAALEASGVVRELALPPVVWA